MKAYERLLNYVVIKTPSDEESMTTPSSACQFDLAVKLKEEMIQLGLSDVVLDDKCYLYGKLPLQPPAMKMCLPSALSHIWILCPTFLLAL